jgi:glycosyltransferase involved in cell wall biosynthesis
MRIAIDAIPLLVRSAGVKNYFFYWITELRRLLGDSQVRLFPFLGRLAELDHQGSIASPAGTLARQALFYGLNHGPRQATAWLAPRADIFHATKLLHPPRRARLTATLHDATCWLLPELHQPANVAAEKLFAQRVWKRAAGLIAVSENTRQDILRILKLNPEQIRVIYPGVAGAYFHATPQIAPRPYALYAGTIEPRKNVDTLLDAWQALPADVREQFDLVMAGPEGWRAERTMARLRSAPAGVRYAGYVPERDLPGLTAGATLFVYPSLYEGFGFPVAQAMAAGTPVLTSDLSSLPEIAAGAAALIDPNSTAEIRAGLERLLTSPSAREQLTQAGRQRAQRFRWDRSARESVAFFEKVLDSGNGGIVG